MSHEPKLQSQLQAQEQTLMEQERSLQPRLQYGLSS